MYGEKIEIRSQKIIIREREGKRDSKMKKKRERKIENEEKRKSAVELIDRGCKVCAGLDRKC